MILIAGGSSKGADFEPLGIAIVESLSRKLGVEVASISPDIINTVVDDA